jgi:hypothetical protein
MKVNKIIIAIVLLLNSSVIFSQENNVSPYSWFSIGDIHYGESGRTSGMASAAIGLSGASFLNTANPASLAALDTCTLIFDITGSGKGSLFRSGDNRQSSFSANFTRITVGLHLTPRWSAGLSLQPYSTVSYRIEDEQYIEGSEMTTPTLYEGSGGITRVSFLNSFRLTDKFSLGADLILLLGNINREVSQSGVTIRHNSTAATFSFVAGLLYKEKLSDNLLFSAGLTYGHLSKLNFDNSIQVQDGSGNILLYDVIASSSIDIPGSLAAGISLKGERMVMAVDYRYQKWSQNHDQITGVNFTDTHKLSGGIAFVPSPTTPGGYMEIIEYQAGLSLSNSYLNINDVNPVCVEATIGAGLPLRNGGQINLGLGWGRNGTLREGLIREDYMRITICFSMTERMFIRRMYD